VSADDEFAEINTTAADFIRMWDEATPANLAATNARTLHMDQHEAARLAAARLGIHPVPHQSELITAAVAFRAAETNGVDVDSDEWLALLDRVRDVADMYLSHLPLAPAALVSNRTDEVLRRESDFLSSWDAGVEARAEVFDIGWPVADEETVSRGIFTDVDGEW